MINAPPVELTSRAGNALRMMTDRAYAHKDATKARVDLESRVTTGSSILKP